MKIVFITNRLSNHQITLCEAFYSMDNVDFSLVETLQEAKSWHIGWQVDSCNYPYVEPVEKVYADLSRIKRKIADADVVIFGSAPDSFVADRIKQGKLTFRYSERFYKHGLHPNNILHAAIGAWLHHGRFQRYPLYMLCASAYTAADAAIFGNYKNRCFRWGYFPECRSYSSIEKLLSEKDRTLIVWAARQIDWKHPETVIEVAQRLKNEKIPFHIHMIGDGELHESLIEKAKKLDLTECISFLGSIPPSEVRNHMEKAGIFMMTSDFQEGWGAVLNEAMNSGCAVAASHAAGATPYLIRSGENGSIYESGNTDELYSRVKNYLLHPELQKRHGEKAYETIQNIWNAEVAAKRFVALSQAILNGNKNTELYEDGPCSKAEIVKNDWYRRGEGT